MCQVMFLLHIFPWQVFSLERQGERGERRRHFSISCYKPTRCHCFQWDSRKKTVRRHTCALMKSGFYGTLSFKALMYMERCLGAFLMFTCTCGSLALLYLYLNHVLFWNSSFKLFYNMYLPELFKNTMKLLKMFECSGNGIHSEGLISHPL